MINASRSPRRLSRATTVLLAVAVLALAGCKPDVTSQTGIQFGTQSTAWGGALTLSASDAFLTAGGKCAFNIEYDMANVGNGPAEPPFWNRLRSGTDVITQQSNLTLAVSEARTVKTQGYLAPGSHTVTLTVDDENDVGESDETNNAFSVAVELTGPCADLADVTSKDEITIGGKTAPWGGTITLDQTDALSVSNGRCAFRVSYGLVNQGSVATSPPFWNRTRAGAEVVTQQSNLELAAGEERDILTDAYIGAGTHTVELSLDDDGQVTESDETNNRFSLRVTVGGRCA